MTDAGYLAHLTHGCCARKLVLYEDEEAEFQAVTEAWRAEYPPNSALEERLLSEVIDKAWQERRCELRFFEVDVLQGVKRPDTWTNDDTHKLSLHIRYKTTAERSFQRKLNQLRTIRQDRLDRIEREIVQQKLRKEQAAQEKAALDAVEKPPKEPDYSVQQQVVVNVQDGIVTSNVYPANDHIEHVLTKHPAFTKVDRFYIFPDGIPPEYAWAVHDSPEDPLPFRIAGQTLSTQQFLIHIQHEAEFGNGHWLPVELDNKAVPASLAPVEIPTPS
jgi:hypothetical protein